MPQRLGWYIPEQLVLKITLIGSDPKIWRRVEVHSGLTLDDLHYVIQCVFEWHNSHLYQFFVSPDGKLTQKARRDARRYHMMPPDDAFREVNADAPADEMLLDRVFTPQCKQIVYEYDFGDSWEHLIKLEKRTAGGDQDHIPCCLAGENAAPSDDMGGIHGFYQWLDALQDPTDQMHEEAIAWLGEDFDAKSFDLEAVNKRLSAAFKLAPKVPRSRRGKK